MNLLRENKIDEAQQHLQIAYRGDPFSAPIVNTLRLIDSFQQLRRREHLPDPSADRGTPGADAGEESRRAAAAAQERGRRCSSRTCSIS